MKQFLLNSVLMTLTALFIRLVSVSFNIYIARKIGFVGVGLLELIMAVYSFAIIFSAAGVSLTATRLVSEELAKNSQNGVKTAMSKCIMYSIVCGIGGCIILLLTANFIGVHILKNASTIKPLCILAFSLPLISVQAAFFGYFTAVRRVAKSAFSQISDQIARIVFTMILLNSFKQKDIDTTCILIAFSIIITEFLSFIIMIFLYSSDIKKNCHGKVVPCQMTKRLLKISIPVALSSYASSALSSIKHIIIPLCLVGYGLSKDVALSYFGMIGGMVIPIITFPCAFLTAISNLIVPEMTECYQLENKKRIDFIASKSIRLTLLFAMGILGVFLRFSNEFGMIIYKDMQIGAYIKILAPLILIIYLDTVVDAMLKGLDKQVNSMFYNITDSIFSIILVIILIPKFGLEGMLFTIFAGKIFNMLLSLNKILKETTIKFMFINWIFKPFCATIGSCTIVKFLSVKILGYSSSALVLIINIVLSLAIYYVILRLISCLKKKDILFFKSIFSK